MTELETYLYETLKQIQLVSQSALHAGAEDDKLALIDRLCAMARTEYESRKAPEVSRDE